MLKINEPEYILIKQYIEEHCGIHLEKDKEYLIESRLSDLVVENRCRSFQEFHFKARTDKTGVLRDQIVDAMTTNETSWFRDKSAWEYLKEVSVPMLLDQAARIGRASVWSAAVSTGQEIYSLLMLLDEGAKARGNPSLVNKIDLIASDISSSALATAKAGRYDAIAINRGLPDDKRDKYFVKSDQEKDQYWFFDPELRRQVQFRKFNLQDRFIFPYMFDLILCRYVSIYFSDIFKRELFSKMATVLKPGGVLLLGATESLREFSSDFEISYYKSAVINSKNPKGL